MAIVCSSARSGQLSTVAHLVTLPLMTLTNDNRHFFALLFVPETEQNENPSQNGPQGHTSRKPEWESIHQLWYFGEEITRLL